MSNYVYQPISPLGLKPGGIRMDVIFNHPNNKGNLKTSCPNVHYVKGWVKKIASDNGGYENIKHILKEGREINPITLEEIVVAKQALEVGLEEIFSLPTVYSIEDMFNFGNYCYTHGFPLPGREDEYLLFWVKNVKKANI